MSTRNVVHSQDTRILAAVLLLVAGGAAAAGAASGSPGGEPVQGVATIATGADMNIDGFLSVAPDDYGQWASVGFAGGGDIFNPAGAAPPIEAPFTSALFLFVPSRSQRIVLTENASHLGTGTGLDDGSLTISVTPPSVPSDTNGDTVDDTLVSSFSATGTDTALGFDLTQAVLVGAPRVVEIRQDYVPTTRRSRSIWSWPGSTTAICSGTATFRTTRWEPPGTPTAATGSCLSRRQRIPRRASPSAARRRFPISVASKASSREGARLPMTSERTPRSSMPSVLRRPGSTTSRTSATTPMGPAAPAPGRRRINRGGFPDIARAWREHDDHHPPYLRPEDGDPGRVDDVRDRVIAAWRRGRKSNPRAGRSPTATG